MTAKAAVLFLLCVALLLVTSVAFGQEITVTPQLVQLTPDSVSTGTTINVPEGSPWWGAIAVAIIGFLIYGGRRYVDHKFNELEKKREAEEQARKDAATERQNEQNLDLAQVNQLGALAESIREMSGSIRTAYQELAEDRKQAAKERSDFHSSINSNNETLKEGIEALRDLTEVVNGTNEANQKEHKITREKVDNINTKIDSVINMLKSKSSGAIDPTETKDITIEVATGALEEVKGNVSKLVEEN